MCAKTLSFSSHLYTPPPILTVPAVTYQGNPKCLLPSLTSKYQGWYRTISTVGLKAVSDDRNLIQYLPLQ